MIHGIHFAICLEIQWKLCSISEKVSMKSQVSLKFLELIEKMNDLIKQQLVRMGAFVHCRANKAQGCNK